MKWRDLPYDKATWEYLDEDCPLRGATEAVKNFEKIRSVMRWWWCVGVTVFFNTVRSLMDSSRKKEKKKGRPPKIIKADVRSNNKISKM